MTSNEIDTRDANPGIIKIIGVGQSLRGDDAAGIEAVRRWHQSCQARHGIANVQVELVELPGVDLLNLLEGSEAVLLVDAVHSGANPGTVHQLDENQLASFTAGSGSAHGWGVAETLALGRRIMPSTMPKKLVLIGVEAGQINLGNALSSEVEAAFPKVARKIEQFVYQANRKE